MLRTHNVDINFYTAASYGLFNHYVAVFGDNKIMTVATPHDNIDNVKISLSEMLLSDFDICYNPNNIKFEYIELNKLMKL